MKRINFIIPGMALLFALSAETMAQGTSSNYEESGGSQALLWVIVVGSLAFFGYRFWQKHKGTVIALSQTVTGKYRVKGDVTTPEAKKILIGAVYADQQGAYLNTLPTGIGDKKYTILGEWWSINGRDTAIDTLDYLRDKAFAYYFPTVWKAFHANSDDERKAIILEAMTTQEDAEKAYSQTLNLMESIDTLRELKVIENVEDIEKYKVFGWDVGRLVFIARLCYDAGYITEEEAWAYIDEAYRKAQSEFRSWEELAKSYVIGRFVWKGKDADDGIAALADDLLQKPDSPWNKVLWND